MTDYNDGKWHGWNGGECPVHPESIIWVVPVKGDKNFTPEMQAKQAIWQDYNHIRALRVVKPYREPREGYIASTIFASAREAKIAYPGCNPIKVREVIE